MTEQRKEGWIYIQQPNGEQRIANPEFIKNLLGVNALRSELESKIEDLRYRIEELEKPERKQKILALLATDKGKHGFEWFKNRVYLNIKQGDFIELLADAKITKIEQKGKTFYGLKQEHES